ncbi:glucose-6-phosphate dehydrogenase [Prolixibacter sp. NT017]|uniref:glucose-6-phosphate dehydrogenase n=1 Tax=Prolixibacter sp. NT017 TaxID=2652390 RepID=UPI0012732763|nr:glucose-6-phosphate dehydrogenase [Prolixibacter sp. NT017]GET24380.1 glucose-6-phosphate 1-dehydrogenase [Prolixibacter sp. NT017]
MDKKFSFTTVIFGASGDLAKRKLIPALYSLYVNQQVPDNFIILGVSRTAYSDIQYREKMKEALIEFGENTNSGKIDAFVEKLFYQPLNYDNRQDYFDLKERLENLQKEKKIPGNIVFYLSTPPKLYGEIPVHLAKVGLNNEDDGWKRLIIEKPFGYDLESATKLKDTLLKYWNENQLYRIDHYLGKETVQNLLVTRFSNGIFEPLWNSKYIHHVEVTSSESLGVEERGGYYESSGALRDMVQNHLLQVVAFTAMEPPATLEPQAIRNEILKVFQSLRPIKPEEVKKVAMRGQYIASTIKNQKVAGYREEPGVDLNSTTETYAALKFYIDNWRWGGIPFYIRTGKRLPTRVTEVVIHFKATPHFLFSKQANCSSCNQLVLRIQPDEGILLKFGMKVPGTGFEVQNVNMDFHYSDLAHQRIPAAYERLIYDSIKGDSTLFARTEEVIEAWKFVMPVLDAWKNNPEIPLFGYPAGTWGPKEADDLIEEKEMTWRYPCKNLADDGIYCEL